MLGPELVELIAWIEAAVTGWAREWNAPEYYFPELLAVTDLQRIDYFMNFPQLALLTAGLRNEALDSGALPRPGSALSAIAAEQLSDSHHVLVSAACYPLFFALKGRRLTEPIYVTLVGRVFRREEYYQGLERLRAFRQREIVCIGPADAVASHLERCRERFTALVASLGLNVTVEIASDAFFGDDPARARMQRLFPTKREFVFDGRLAVASLNAHRNFFGERCDISLPDGEYAFTGCFGVGLERLCGALIARHGSVEQALSRARDVRIVKRPPSPLT